MTKTAESWVKPRHQLVAPPAPDKTPGFSGASRSPRRRTGMTRPLRLNLAETYRPLAGSSGQLEAAHVDAWLADQRRAVEDGTFFAACNYYAYVARR